PFRRSLKESTEIRSDLYSDPRLAECRRRGPGVGRCPSTVCLTTSLTETLTKVLRWSSGPRQRWRFQIRQTASIEALPARWQLASSRAPIFPRSESAALADDLRLQEI